MRLGHRLVLSLLAFVLAAPCPARVISYSPVTDRLSVPAVQRRDARHYVLMEREPTPGCGTCGSTPIRGRLVLYDSQGLEGPRVVLPSGDAVANLHAAAVWEDDAGTVRILVRTDAAADGLPAGVVRYLYSPDAGTTWKAVMPAPYGGNAWSSWFDRGGPIARERGSQIRLGTADTPFVFAERPSGGTSVQEIWALSSSGAARRLAASPRLPFGTTGAYGTLTLIGTSASGDQMLLAGAPEVDPRSTSLPSWGLYILDLAGRMTKVVDTGTTVPLVQGWIAPDGGVYIDGSWTSGRPAGLVSQRGVAVIRNHVATELAVPQTNGTVFAVPTALYSGAWIVERTTTATTLLRHEPTTGKVEQWRDVSAPQVEALHPSASGRRVLVQVHRSRPTTDQRLFRDPALAVWSVGHPMPRDYDELFLTEYDSRSMVHLDVDAMSDGDPFVFDSGWYAFVAGGGPSGGGTGGSDVVQEWGVVRASLRQRLVIPAVARAGGAFGSLWRTDLVLRNPDLEQLDVEVRLGRGAAMGRGENPSVVLTLAAGEVRVVPDVLHTLFGLPHASGALYLSPRAGRAVNATSRTYTSTSQGTYGMGVSAMELLSAASLRFPYTFAAAFQAGDFRTNFVAADAGSRGGTMSLSLLPELATGFSVRELLFETPPEGQQQVDGLGTTFGLPSFGASAALYRPLTGESVAGAIVIDNRTNDPTYFPPDLPSNVVRVVPAIVHQDGANGARFRSDLHLVNVAVEPRTVTLAMKPWDTNEPETLQNVTLQPGESRVLRDVLRSLFGRTGVARLRYQSLNAVGLASDGIRLTSRTYTITSSGGTYGNLMPPLNSFQSAGVGETLEILGPMGGRSFRTNLSLVELTTGVSATSGPPVRVRIEILDDRTVLRDRFEVNVPVAGGLQLDDLFRARGLGDGPPAAILRVIPLGGLVGAYATMIDNGTNDPTLFVAGLAAN